MSRGPLPASNFGNLDTFKRAEEAIAYLIDNGSYVSKTKEQFAYALNWVQASGATVEPMRHWVEEAANYTRDFPELFGGMCIAYSPSAGGMALVDPTDTEVVPEAHLSILRGDLEKQDAVRTMNRRRLPMWRSAGDAWALRGDTELARLYYAAEDQIRTTGFVDETTKMDVFKAHAARGHL